MNLAYVVHRLSPTEGTGGYVVRLASALAARHAVTVYAADADHPLPPGITWVRVPALRRPASATILTFPRHFARRRPADALIHAQGWVTDDAEVVTAHIVFAAWRRAAAAAGVRPPPGEWLAGRWVARREAALFRRARAVIAPSRRVADEIAEVSGRGAAVDVIPHGFPDPAPEGARGAARAALGMGDVPLALFVGDARKGLARALEAVARVREVHLGVVSHSRPGPWQARARRLGVHDRLHWFGPRREPTPCYDAADVLLYPTPYDTFGLVIAEAMARGCPAITTPMAGVTELYGPAAGWIVSGTDPDETAVALVEALADAGRRGAAARDVAARRPWSRVVAETVTVYERFA